MRSVVRSLVAAGVVVAALAGRGHAPFAAAAPQAPTPPPVFRSGINFVRVDVIVSDKSGGSVADLKQGDFDVLEDGKPQAIETFKLIKLDGGAVPTGDGPPRQIRNDYDEETEAARDDVRLFAVFLDDYHVRFGAGVVARAPLTRFIENQLGPSDMLGVMLPLESIGSVRMTRDRASVIRAIQQFRGRKGDYKPMNDLESRYAHYPAETVERIRNQVSLNAIKALIVHMGGLKEGRKALILVSEGYSNSLPPQLRDPVAIMPGFGNPNEGNSAAGINDLNEDRYQFFQNQDLEFFLQGVYEAANQNNVAIYAVDPRGLPVFEYDIDRPVNTQVDGQFLRSTQNTLRTLALETDGRAILNRNDLDVGMKQIVRDSSAYYLLGYTSAQAKLDGKFHAITVRVNRPGVQIRARKGYWALTPETTTFANPAAPRPVSSPALEAAFAAVNQPAHARVVRTWIGTSRGENGKTKVTFVWEPVARVPGERSSGNPGSDDQPARVSLMAVGPDGAPIFRGRVPDVALAALSPIVPASAPSAVRGPSRTTFDAKPGKMQLRVAVEGAGSQVLDTEIREITVPDSTAPQVSLGTPELFRARTARDYQQIKADPDAVPVAAREFSRTERVLVRVAAYGPANTTPALKARMLSRTGQPMNDLIVAPAAIPGGRSQIEVPLSGLAPGEYLIEITASPGDHADKAGVTASGEAGESKELVGIRITA